MNKSSSDQDLMNKLVEECRGMVASMGFYIQTVGGSETSPSYTYSVGLENHLRHPEIVIVGFPPTLCHQIIHSAVARIRNGARYDRPCYAQDIVQGYDVAFLGLTSASVSAHTGFGQAVIGRSFEAVQMFLPDEQGRFPWDEGCDRAYWLMQNQIFEQAGDPPSRQITAPDTEDPAV